MKMTDETLSAFLDNELTHAEMEAVRDQVAEDPTLTDRLAELASVDDALQKHYGSIDERPMPEAVTRLVKETEGLETGSTTGNVISFPWWRRVREDTGKAIAAVLIAGVVMFQWTSTSGDPAWPAVARVLENEPSGQVYQLDQGAALTPRLSFSNQNGGWCRQFRLEAGDAASERIACRDDSGDWAQVARVDVASTSDAELYQTATGGSVMDDTLDTMMSGPPVGPDREKELLDQHWSD